MRMVRGRRRKVPMRPIYNTAKQVVRIRPRISGSQPFPKNGVHIPGGGVGTAAMLGAAGVIFKQCKTRKKRN